MTMSFKYNESIIGHLNPSKLDYHPFSLQHYFWELIRNRLAKKMFLWKFRDIENQVVKIVNQPGLRSNAPGVLLMAVSLLLLLFFSHRQTTILHWVSLSSLSAEFILYFALKTI